MESLPVALHCFKDAWAFLTPRHPLLQGCVGPPYPWPLLKSRMRGASFSLAATCVKDVWDLLPLRRLQPGICLDFRLGVNRNPIAQASHFHFASHTSQRHVLLLQTASFPSPPPASRMHGTSSPFSASCLKDAWNLLAPRRPHLKDAWKVFPSPCIASRMRGPSLPRATLYFKDAWGLLTLGHFLNPG